MRSVAGFYFLLRYPPFLFYALGLQYTFLIMWTYCVLIFLSSTILIALVKPYKNTYMNVLDTLLLALQVYTCAVLSNTLSVGMETNAFIVFCIPIFAFGLGLLSIVLIKLYKWVSTFVKDKFLVYTNNYSLNEPNDQSQPLMVNS